MGNLGPVWEDDEQYSPSRNNAKGITRDTGTNLVAIASTKQLGAVCPTDTSAGLIKNVLYVVDYTTEFNRIEFVPVFGIHRHDAETDEAGGLYLYTRHNNEALFVDVTMNIQDTGIFLTNATNGTLTRVTSTDDSYLLFDTLSATNNHITGTMSGPRFDLSEKLLMHFHAEVTGANTNILARIGINVDRVDEAQSTSRRQMGIEACDGHGTNWVLINANGNSASLVVTATTMGITPAVQKWYKILHIPATECRVYDNGTSNAVSNTNVASSGNTTNLRLFRAGIKLPTGTTSKQIKLWDLQIMADPNMT